MSEVDDKGQVLTQFTDVDWPNVSSPYHLSTTSEDGVLVADCYSHRILQLSSQLDLERVLLDRNYQDKLRYPRRLHYNKLTSQLYVLHRSEPGSRPGLISQWSLR